MYRKKNGGDYLHLRTLVTFDRDAKPEDLQHAFSQVPGARALWYRTDVLRQQNASIRIEGGFVPTIAFFRDLFATLERLYGEQKKAANEAHTATRITRPSSPRHRLPRGASILLAHMAYGGLRAARIRESVNPVKTSDSLHATGGGRAQAVEAVSSPKRTPPSVSLRV